MAVFFCVWKFYSKAAYLYWLWFVIPAPPKGTKLKSGIFDLEYFDGDNQ